MASAPRRASRERRIRPRCAKASRKGRVTFCDRSNSGTIEPPIRSSAVMNTPRATASLGWAGA
jgi:hypothetical protein